MKRKSLSIFAIAVVLATLSVSLWSVSHAAPTTKKTTAQAPKRERIEWIRVWLTNANKTNKPRVLFVGDSIVNGYFNATEKQLTKEANCAMLATSACICDPLFFDQLGMVLKHFTFDVIHFNNALHGWDYSEEDYKKAFPKLVKFIQTHQPKAKLIYRLGTPVRVRGNLKKLHPQKNPRLIQRNEIAKACCKAQNITVDDLYTPMSQHPEYFRSDAIHYNGKGVQYQAKHVTAAIKQALK